MRNSNVDSYLREGCGRCALGGTPDCKVHFWTKELERLRSLIIDCGLLEEVKWSVPCYTYNGKNIAIVSAFKNYASLSFFKGALLSDSKKLLHQQGQHSNEARIFKFTRISEIEEIEDDIKTYIYEAIEIEKQGLKVPSKAVSEYEMPIEFQEMLNASSELNEAFNALTPGRKKGYLLHFSQAKQAKTRIARIEKYIPHIMNGKGFHDR